MNKGTGIADKFVGIIGSWKFLIGQSAVLLGYILINLLGSGSAQFDPYPFIFLNLMLSFQAAYTAPIIMISQNKMAEMDRKAALEDYANVVTILEHVKALESRLVDKIDEVVDGE